MTAAQTRKLVQTYYDAFNARDVEGMLACLGASFVHEVSQGGKRKGKALFKDFLTHMNKSYRETLSNIVVMTDQTGMRAAAEFDLKGNYLATDAGLPEAKGQSYKLRVAPFSRSGTARSRASRLTIISRTGRARCWRMNFAK